MIIFRKKVIIKKRIKRLEIGYMNNKSASKNYTATKYACYTVNLSMSVVASLSPLLFLTFHDTYGFSFSMLGALVFINFCTQLIVDLIFSFYSHKFDIAKTVKFTPVLTVAGLLIYALFPYFFPDAAYVGIVIGTIIFASSGGLVEVLISPVIAEIPSDNPEREMSKLHSVYAWGVVGVVILSTLFLTAFGKEYWQVLALLWTVVPLISCVLFAVSEIPPLKTPERASNVVSLIKGREFLICFFCILLGGASECTMAQWSSSYIEQALGIPKVWGDVFGVALFSMMLGLGRTLYAKYGKDIYKVLVLGACGAVACYLTAVFTTIPAVGLIACAVTGFCVSMLWPGSLIVASDRFPSAGVAVFALMAAGGDFGGAVGPQIVGAVTDLAIKSESVAELAGALNMTAGQLGMKAGLLSAVIFPVLAAAVFYVVYRQHKAMHNS